MISLLAKIEAEYNAVVKQMQALAQFENEAQYNALKEKKEQLAQMAHDYVALEQRYKTCIINSAVNVSVCN